MESFQHERGAADNGGEECGAHLGVHLGSPENDLPLDHPQARDNFLADKVLMHQPETESASIPSYDQSRLIGRPFSILSIETEMGKTQGDLSKLQQSRAETLRTRVAQLELHRHASGQEMQELRQRLEKSQAELENQSRNMGRSEAIMEELRMERDQSLEELAQLKSRWRQVLHEAASAGNGERGISGDYNNEDMAAAAAAMFDLIKGSQSQTAERKNSPPPAVRPETSTDLGTRTARILEGQQRWERPYLKSSTTESWTGNPNGRNLRLFQSQDDDSDGPRSPIPSTSEAGQAYRKIGRNLVSKEYYDPSYFGGRSGSSHSGMNGHSQPQQLYTSDNGDQYTQIDSDYRTAFDIAVRQRNEAIRVNRNLASQSRAGVSRPPDSQQAVALAHERSHPPPQPRAPANLRHPPPRISPQASQHL